MSHGGESVSSLDSTNDKANGHISSGSQFGVEKGEHIARRQLGSEAHHAGTDIKGKGRATDNPFSDPSDPEYESTLSRSASSNKPRPTAHHPIVTIGGTPVVRRHLGHRIGPDGQELPSIVSTDADATGKYDMKRGGASYGKLARKPGTITEDVEEDRHAAIDGDAGAGAAIARQIGERAPPSRKSTADSRFNEIDLEDNTEEEEDSHPHGHSEEQGAVTPRQVQLGTGQGRGRHGQLHSRPAGAHEEGRRVAWWTEWLFCCGGPPPDDEQVRC
ncbi:hypothetical protein K437DRAFT_258471 [Tilletiaria anomala UBC 951]|uniref:Uncharacterized protein n=1 Tax=Tilletiaria anomala (strain ATCC 24038 / CBS 436.72 / UBC 951) TaxID=1037660 RepID=A0A066VGW2_TILAU|nr:uncharacterized protein K437DRAFT_258471 [Tilletiaria anomala UBC 951]KDN40967.1 hypothetical protein K437DRAFT_258471 [Tilletiaria anomala UBC 951]